MGAEQQGNPGPAAEVWLDWLHREAEDDLGPAELAALKALSADPQVQQTRARLRAVTGLLSGLPTPELPGSVAAEVAQDVSWNRRLGGEAVPRPASMAAMVAAEIALAGQLRAQPVAPAPSVAPAVLAEIQAARLLAAGPTPTLPRSIAPGAAAEVAWTARLATPAPVPAVSVAGAVLQRVAAERAAGSEGAAQTSKPASLPGQVLGQAAVRSGTSTASPYQGRHNPAPLLLVLALMIGLTTLGISTVWPNLAAGALVMRTLLAQISPLVGVGLLLLLATSGLITWRPAPAMQRAGAGAFMLSAVLTIPALYGVAARGDVRFGQDVTVSTPVPGNVIAVGGNVYLEPGARVEGEVVTFLGDVHQQPGAQVGGRINALLGHAPDDRNAIETSPPQGMGLATAAAFRPVLGWLGSAAWPQVFVSLTGGALLLLFVSGFAPMLARRQRHAPMHTLALGVLVLSALLGPAVGLGLAGLLGPALLAAALVAVLMAVGLSISAYDVGRALAFSLRLPVPDVVGAMLGLTAIAASLSLPPLAFALAVIGGTWGAGTLLLTRSRRATLS